VSRGKVNRSAMHAAVPAVRSCTPRPGVDTCFLVIGITGVGGAVFVATTAMFTWISYFR